MGSVFDNGGYVGKRAFLGTPLGQLVVTAGPGAVGQGSTSITWTHTPHPDDNYILAAISAYNYESDTAWVGSATCDGSPMTVIKAGYRLAVFGAPISSASSKAITYNIGNGYTMYSAGNSISIRNGTVGSATYSGADGGTHALSGTGAANSMWAFFTGQVWDSAAPTTPSGFSRQFWSRQTSGYSAVGCYTAVVSAGGSVSFSVYTGNGGSTIGVPISGTAS